MKHFITFFIVVAGIFMGWLLFHQYLISTSHPPAHISPPTLLPTKNIQHLQVLRPIHIRIPRLKIDTQVESVGLDNQGRMDVPKHNENVAWYDLGAVPGQIGSAVLAGHYDTTTGAPAVFYNLSQLKSGDTITLFDSNSKSLTFVVQDSQKYEDATFPIMKVFTQADKPRLNLITCNGIWNPQAHNYSERLVIYSVLQGNTL